MEVAMKLSVFRKPMLAMFLFTVATLAAPHDARAFCGFYVGKADCEPRQSRLASRDGAS